MRWRTDVAGQNNCLRHRDGSFANLLAANIERDQTALAETAAGIGELHTYLMFPAGQRSN